MAIVRVKLGEALRINLQDFDGKAGLFPQAILRDDTGSELSGSPVDLAHTADGLYQDKSIVMPNTPMVTAVMKTYTDAGHTVLSDDHEDAIQVFLREDVLTTQTGIAVIERIEATLSQTPRLHAELVADHIQGMLSIPRLEARLALPAIQGVLKQQKIIGLITECC